MDASDDPVAEATVPEISVIIVTYNVRDWTLACLASLARDRSLPQHAVEVVVVDNASNDGTAEAVAREFPSAVLVRNKENLGFSRGNNEGLRVATGKYLFLLNSDTEVYDGALGALTEFMDSHPDAGACGPQILNLDGSIQPSGRPLPSVWSVFVDMSRIWKFWKDDVYAVKGRDYNAVAEVGEVSGAALLVRKSIYDSSGGFDPNLFIYYEDVDWCRRIHDMGFKVYYVPSARIMHRWQRITGVISERSYKAGQDSIRYYFRKHHGRGAEAAIQCMLSCKEALKSITCTLRGQSERARFHLSMLRRALAPAPMAGR